MTEEQARQYDPERFRRLDAELAQGHDYQAAWTRSDAPPGGRLVAERSDRELADLTVSEAAAAAAALTAEAGPPAAAATSSPH